MLVYMYRKPATNYNNIVVTFLNNSIPFEYDKFGTE